MRWLPDERGSFILSIATLVLIAGTQVSAADPQAARPPTRSRPPMFSSTYVKALQGVTDMEPRDAAMLEQRLARDPDDFSARLKLIAYCMRPDRLAVPQSRTQRTELVLWLVEQHPDSEILASPYAVLSVGDLGSDRLQKARSMWEAATKRSPTDARLAWNAANFFSLEDRHLYIDYLQRAVALAPDNQNYAQTLGLLYAGAILTDPELAGRSTEILDTTSNQFLLEPAVRLLQSDYNRSLMMGSPNARLGELAARYFQRAKALDPALDEEWIYPKIDPKMVGMFAPGARPPDDGRPQFEAAAKNIRRLPPGNFQKLPEAISKTLRTRGCLVPQPNFNDKDPGKESRNVISGEFLEKGKTAWAVLCSINESSSILVFRQASDAQPMRLATWKDDMYLQGAGNGKIAYSRELRPADRQYIVRSAHANAAPEPPPIDHQGINDIFLGKASTVYYWYRGAWLKLSGDD